MSTKKSDRLWRAWEANERAAHDLRTKILRLEEHLARLEYGRNHLLEKLKDAALGRGGED